MDLSRRDCLRLGALAGLSALIPSWLTAGDPPPIAAGAAGGRARRLIWLYMAGGMSHLDTFDPKPGRPEQGPTGTVASGVDGVQLSEHLPRVAKQLHRCALLRSVTSTQGAHEQGEYLMRTGYTARGTVQHPCTASWLSLHLGKGNPTLPSVVAISPGSRHPGAGFLEGVHAPVPLGDPSAGLPYIRRPDGVTVSRQQARLAMLAKQDASFVTAYDARAVRAIADMHGEAVKLMEAKDLAAFDLSKERSDVLAAYGDTGFGRGCCLARRLIEHDVRAVEVNLGGWDTHADNFDRVETQAGILDAGLSALLEDLDRRGLLDETLVVLASEFGRTPTINQNQGRDHYPKCFTVLMAGGGVRGGRIHGASDERGAAPARDPVHIPDITATVAYACGVPIDRIHHAPDGRPFTIADKGRPVTALFA